ncbi:MAG: Nif3-like dinuclear metal center hexameric protein [Filimonas sp.]|nr:Nif3-like dinuclear metal center hexameric protein [Filimonas sp.]
MKIGAIIQELEKVAPPAYQESYDNAGLLTGNASWECTGVICSLDATEAVVAEAIAQGCNLVVAHHPIIFGGLKKITGRNYIERTVIAAIKNDIAIYAIHTNLDNVVAGVSNKMAEKLGLINRSILAPKAGLLMKLYTFVPGAHLEQVKDALFKAGAGQIGNYSECSFSSGGNGTFKASEGTSPFVGAIGERHTEPEQKLEVIFPAHLKNSIVAALKKAHPYEEVAYDLVNLSNDYQEVGSGMIGELPEEVEESAFLQLLKDRFSLDSIRHTPLRGKKVKSIALCGGAGFFLLGRAIASGADVYITADVKYHEFFDADGRILLADIGHWESEQFTIDLLFDILLSKFPTFAVLKTKVRTNPVYYF